MTTQDGNRARNGPARLVDVGPVAESRLYRYPAEWLGRGASKAQPPRITASDRAVDLHRNTNGRITIERLERKYPRSFVSTGIRRFELMWTPTPEAGHLCHGGEEPAFTPGAIGTSHISYQGPPNPTAALWSGASIFSIGISASLSPKYIAGQASQPRLLDRLQVDLPHSSRPYPRPVLR